MVTAVQDTPPRFAFTPYTEKPRCIEACDSTDLLQHFDGLEPGTRCEVTIGIQIDTAAATESLGLDWEFSDQANPLFGLPDLSYVPDDLLRNRIGLRTIQTVSGPLTFRVPRADALAFMKLKAYRDRSLQWTLSRDPDELAALSREDARQVRSRPTAYWERKAGKDLYDLCFLLGSQPRVGQRLQALMPGDRLDAELRRGLIEIPQALRSFALDMARRSRVTILEPAELHDRLGASEP